MPKYCILLSMFLFSLAGCYDSSTDDTAWTQSYKTPELNDLGVKGSAGISESTSRTTYSGILESVESAPGVIILEVKKSSGQTEMLFTPSLIDSTLFGPPKVGDSISWKVDQTDNNVFIPELNKSFEKLQYVQFIHKLPSEGMITSIEKLPDGVSLTVKVSGNSSVEQFVKLFSQPELLNSSLHPGVLINWENEFVVSTYKRTSGVPIIKVSKITNSNG
ncbi:MAG: hypothetical protein SWN10_14030 [Pseudomonadota bacterium]|nr:hypothetical protein [Pseudomonadota bacterium]